MAFNRSPETNERYAQILKPIKDLAKSWDVDIASNLEDYLDELEGTTISYDGGKTTMNFAQAAMLIHSSTCIYSKKVECLYNLTLQVLELLANKKKLNQKSSVDKDGNDDDAQNLNDDDDEFLSLDDIEESKNLYMKENFDSDRPFQFLPEVPLCLLPLENAAKGDNPLLSKKGEVLASINDFRMNTCYRHKLGTLLIDKSFIKLHEDSMGRQTEVDSQQVDNVPATNTETEQNIDIDDHNDGNDMCVDDGGNDDDYNDDDIGVLNDISNGDPDNQPQTDEEVRLGLRRSERQRDKVLVAKKQVNHWEKLKLDEETSTGNKPFKSGTVYKTCRGIEDKTKKRKRTKQPDVKIEPLHNWIAKSLYSQKKKFPKNQIKMRAFHDFEKLCWEEFKRRQLLQKEILKKRREELMVEDNNGDNDDDDYDDDNDAPLLQPDDNDDDIGDLVDENLFQAIDNALGHNESFMSHHGPPCEQDLEDCTAYEQMVQKYVDDYMKSAKKYAHITELSRRVSEWEDKVIPRLEEEENHPPFDINNYSTNIIDDLDETRTIKFQQLVQGKPLFEICRTFLASLMLANTTNVKIKENRELADGMDQFELELLSTRRHFEQLQEYVAPSLAGK